ncbi:hypothetical protein N328_02325, partial [Gavia stellata]
MSPLVPSASPRRCRPGFLQLDWPSCCFSLADILVELPLWVFPKFFHISRHLFSKNSQQL